MAYLTFSGFSYEYNGLSQDGLTQFSWSAPDPIQARVLVVLHPDFSLRDRYGIIIHKFHPLEYLASFKGINSYDVKFLNNNKLLYITTGAVYMSIHRNENTHLFYQNANKVIVDMFDGNMNEYLKECMESGKLIGGRHVR